MLGVGFGIAVAVGNTIGAGIFRAPGEVAARLPDPWWYMAAWAVGGAYALLGAIQIAELGAMLPRSGGPYVFTRHALGPYAGFVVGWTDWLGTCGTTAAVSIVVGEFSGALWPALRGQTVPIAAAVTIAFAAVQWRGIRWGSLVQNVTSLAKALAFVALIAAAFMAGGGTSQPAAAPPGPGLTAAFVMALQAVIYTYDGWTGPVYFGEEIENPGRNVPRAVLGSVSTVIVIYLLVNLAFLHVLPVTALAGQEFAAGAVAGVILGTGGERILLGLTVLSMLSAINAYHLMGSRTAYALSRDGLLHARATTVNRGGTPAIALLLGTCVSLLFILLGQTFQQVITVLAFLFVAIYTLSFVSVFVLRRREPARPRPYRAWGYPWSTGVALAGSVAFLVGVILGDTRNSVYALLLLAVSYPVFRAMRGR